jgi:hypothetical protein
MFLAQIIAPAVLVLAIFGVGHLFVQSNYSGIYTPKVILDAPESEEPEEVLSEAAARAFRQESFSERKKSEFLLMPDKYNYLKIEYVRLFHQSPA